MDLINFLPQLASWLHMAPSTLLALIVAVIKIADVIARLIPDDAKGWLAVVRKICKFIGINVASRITGSMTVNDAAKATLSFPEVQAKVVDAKDAEK